MLIELIEICPTSYDLHGYTVKSNSRNMCVYTVASGAMLLVSYLSSWVHLTETV
jgi:hypothetical protein